MRKYILSESEFRYLLKEARSREEVLQILQQKYPNNHYIQSILDLDPTKKCSYTIWACKAIGSQSYVYSSILNQVSILFDYATKYHDFQLQNYETIDDAIEGLEEMQGKQEYEIVYNDEKFEVFTPHSYLAERYIVWHIFDGASWCTAADSDYGISYYDNYTDAEDNNLYIIHDKNNNKIYQYATKNQEFRDSNNDAVTKEMLEPTEGMLEWFKVNLNADLGDIMDIEAREEFEQEAEIIRDDKGNFLCYLYQHQLYNDYNDLVVDTEYYGLNSRHGDGYATFERYLIISTSYYDDRVDVFYLEDDGRLEYQLTLDIDMAEYRYKLLVGTSGNQVYIIDADCDEPGPPYAIPNVYYLETIGNNYESWYKLACIRQDEQNTNGLFHPFAEDYILDKDIDEDSIYINGSDAYYTKKDENGQTHYFYTDHIGYEQQEITKKEYMEATGQDIDDDEDYDDDYTNESIKPCKKIIISETQYRMLLNNI